MAKNYHPHIKVNVTQNEKDKIDALARQHNMSTSAFVKIHLSTLLQENKETISTPYEYEAEKRNHVIRVPVSPNELNTIKEKANGKTIASYIRNTSLNGSKTIKIDVYDEDIKELLHLLHPTVTRTHGILDGVRIMGEIQDSQYFRLVEMLDTIQKHLKSVAENTYKNRKSIRQSGLRELKKQYKQALKTNHDILAQFEEYEDSTKYIEY